MIQSDSLTEKASRRSTTARLWFYGSLAAVSLLGVLINYPQFSNPTDCTKRAGFVAELKGLFAAMKIYAGDHGGKFPPQLGDLEPDYLGGETLANMKYQDPKSGNLIEPIYFAGYTASTPPSTIILGSTLADGKYRMVGFADGSCQVIPDAKYQELLKKQPPREW